MPNIFDYAFAPAYAKAQDDARAEHLRQQAAAEAIARSYRDVYANSSPSQEILKDPNAAFISRLIESRNPEAVTFAQELYQQQQNRAPADSPSYSYQKDGLGNVWAINKADPTDKHMVLKGAPQVASGGGSAGGFGDSTITERMLTIVADPNIPKDDPRRLAARKYLEKVKRYMDPASGQQITEPGMDLIGIDPFYTDADSPKERTPGQRTPDQVKYDTFTESAIPTIEAYNNYVKLIEQHGPSMIGADAAEIDGAGISLMTQIQKLNEWGVLNEGDTRALMKLIGDATSLKGKIPGVVQQQLRQLRRDLMSKVHAKQESFKGTSVTRRELPAFYNPYSDEKSTKKTPNIGETITTDSGVTVTRVPTQDRQPVELKTGESVTINGVTIKRVPD